MKPQSNNRKKRKPTSIEVKEEFTHVLLIDDVRSIPRGCIARDYETAIMCLQFMPKFDYVYLDFDFRNDTSRNPKTGHDVLLWLEKNPEQIPGHIKLVSANKRGLMDMRRVLDRFVNNNWLDCHS